MRHIQGLKWVQALSARPECIPLGRAIGAKGRGVAYENAVASAEGFGVAHRGQWFAYVDASGGGYAQTDFIFGGEVPIVVEAKLTWTPQAYVQLRKLYWPLLRAMTNAPVGGIVVCQNLTRDTPKGHVVEDLSTALTIARSEPGVVPVLHLPLLRAGVSGTKRRTTYVGMPTWWKKGNAAQALH